MFRGLALLNLLLLGMSGLLAHQVHEAWNSPPPNFSAPPQKPSPQGGAKGKVSDVPTHKPNPNDQKNLQKPSAAATLPPMEAYQIIGQTNPFRPDRKEWVPPPPPPSAMVVPPKPALPPASSFRLYGTLNLPDGSAVALMEGPPLGVTSPNPSSPMGRRFPSIALPTGGRSEPGRAKRYRIDDLIGGYRIVEIRSDRVVMEGEGLRVEVLLRDPNAPKQRPAAPPPVLAAPAPPRPSVAPTSPQRVFPPPPPPPGSPAPAPQPSLGQPQASSEGESAASAPPFQPGTQVPPRGRTRQVIQTPFGPKVIYR